MKILDFLTDYFYVLIALALGVCFWLGVGAALGVIR